MFSSFCGVCLWLWYVLLYDEIVPCSVTSDMTPFSSWMPISKFFNIFFVSVVQSYCSSRMSLFEHVLLRRIRIHHVVRVESPKECINAYLFITHFLYDTTTFMEGLVRVWYLSWAFCCVSNIKTTVFAWGHKNHC